jgi:hypothetical protein
MVEPGSVKAKPCTIKVEPDTIKVEPSIVKLEPTSPEPSKAWCVKYAVPPVVSGASRPVGNPKRKV